LAGIFKRDEVEVDEFWKMREEDLGLPILGKALGQVIRENGFPQWGLFYTTSKALYFQTFQSDNWLMRLFSGGQGRGNRTGNEIIEIPIEGIEVFRVRPKKGGLLKFFQKPPFIELSWRDSTGKLKWMNFETSGDAEGLLELCLDSFLYLCLFSSSSSTCRQLRPEASSRMHR